MDAQRLHDHLEKLHEELSTAQRVDPRSQQLLGELMADIKRLRERSAATPFALSSADLSLPERLERIAVQFEVNHPTLAASSRRLVDLLGKVGV